VWKKTPKWDAELAAHRRAIATRSAAADYHNSLNNNALQPGKENPPNPQAGFGINFASDVRRVKSRLVPIFHRLGTNCLAKKTRGGVAGKRASFAIGSCGLH
jgi:hypothetical protein